MKPWTNTRSRSSRTYPPRYNAAKVELFDVGTWVNETHWQFTAKCTGCTSWNDPAIGPRYLNPKGRNTIAWATANLPPVNPENPDSLFTIHDVHGYFEHQFDLGNNAEFEKKVAADRVAVKPSPTTTGCAFTWTPPPGALILTTTVTTTVATATVTATVTVPPKCP
jgi:hypothetical protein